MRSLLLSLLLAPAAFGQSFTGTLGDGNDLARTEGEPYDRYTFTAQKNQQVTVRMTSEDFDTYLIVRTPDGTVHENDDFEGVRVSQLEFVAPADGTYEVWASSFSGEASGGYEAVVTLGGIAQVEQVEGRLDPRDEVLPKGEYVDRIERTISATSPFTVELESYGFDGYLIVKSPSGQYFRNDDDGSTTMARVRSLQPASGTWTIYVTSASPEAVGAYDLRIVTF